MKSNYLPYGGMLCFVKGLSAVRMEGYFLHSQTTADIILNGKTLEAFWLVRNMIGMPSSIVPKMLASTTRQEKQIGGVRF